MSEKRNGNYDCSDCPAYCCSVYERVAVDKRDLKRLANHFGLSVEATVRRFTKIHGGERVLRQRADPIFGKACSFLNPDTRQCTIYHARPKVCRDFPGQMRCAYYDLLTFERELQSDKSALPLVQITFLNGELQSRSRQRAGKAGGVVT